MNRVNTKGFTLIELMLAMTFISVLLVAIAMTTIQISNIYNKGITLREVDQAGRSLSNELQRNIAASAPFDVTPKKDDSPATKDSKYVVRNEDGGRLCLGSYSYLWNFGKALEGTGGAVIYNKYSDDNNTQIRFVKVVDAAGKLCADPETMPAKAQSTDLLTSGDRDLVLHKFSIERTSDVGMISQAIYAISFTIGTNDREQLATNDTSCKPPSEKIDTAYCSVNQFDIIARAGNRVEE